MLSDGFKLMIIGMGTVFVFLGLMSLIIQLASRLLAPFNHLVMEKQPAVKPRAKAAAISGDDTVFAAAAAAAVKRYQDEHQ